MKNDQRMIDCNSFDSPSQTLNDQSPSPSQLTIPLNKTAVTWPAPVKCSMNIVEWEYQLKTFNLLQGYGFLLLGFKHGFHQGIPSHHLEGMKWFCPPNHSLALMVKEKIMKNIEKELLANRIFGPFAKQTVYDHLGFFRTSPLGAVENSDKSFRPINDFSYPRNDPEIPSVNSFVNKDDFETT